MDRELSADMSVTTMLTGLFVFSVLLVLPVLFTALSTLSTLSTYTIYDTRYHH